MEIKYNWKNVFSRLAIFYYLILDGLQAFCSELIEILDKNRGIRNLWRNRDQILNKYSIKTVDFKNLAYTTF